MITQTSFSSTVHSNKREFASQKSRSNPRLSSGFFNIEAYTPHFKADPLPEEKIKKCAFLFFLQDGCPKGRDEEYMKEAELMLRVSRLFESME